jgi:hypothetical protein
MRHHLLFRKKNSMLRDRPLTRLPAAEVCHLQFLQLPYFAQHEVSIPDRVLGMQRDKSKTSEITDNSLEYNDVFLKHPILQ